MVAGLNLLSIGHLQNIRKDIASFRSDINGR